MQVLVTVEGKWRGFRPSESPLQAGCDMDEACSVRRTGGKELRARENSSLGKDGRSLREDGTREK